MLPPMPPPLQPPLASSAGDSAVLRHALLVAWLSFSIFLPFAFAFVLCLLPCVRPGDDDAQKQAVAIAKPPRGKGLAALRKRLSKPFYRWSFRQGRRFTDESIGYFTCKYLRKYLVKRQKLKIEGELKLSKETIESLIQAAMGALLTGKDMHESLSLRHANDVSGATLTGFGDFGIGLHAAASTNIGLSHAKAREYWIYRGPRQLATTISFISGVFIINEVIKQPTFEDRVVNVSGSMLAMLTALVMLYYRLPDSIRSGVCRSAHDYYAKGKRDLEREARMALERANREEPSQSNSELDSNNDSDDGVGSPSLLIAHRKRRHTTPRGGGLAALSPIPSAAPVRGGASWETRDEGASPDAATPASAADQV